jgi:hypothetical protein
VVFTSPKLEVSPFVASGELHVVLARRMILDQRYDRAAVCRIGSISHMWEELLDRGFSVLTREMLVYVGLVESPEIDGLMTFKIGDTDEIALCDRETRTRSRGHANFLPDCDGSTHAAPPFS